MSRSFKVKVLAEAKALAEETSRRHVLLRLDLCEVEGAGEDEHVHQVDEALQEGDGRLHRQALRRFDVLHLVLGEERRRVRKSGGRFGRSSMILHAGGGGWRGRELNPGLHVFKVHALPLSKILYTAPLKRCRSLLKFVQIQKC